MSTEEKIIKNKVGLLRLAECLNSDEYVSTLYLH
jgi:hypothetical protein